MTGQTRRPSGRAHRDSTRLSGATLVVAGTIGALGISSPAARAQSAAGADGLQEVTVTARYTEENLQTTPLAITAITVEQLKAANVNNVTNLGALVPNLHTHPGDASQSSSPTIVMRGVVENSATYAREPGVGVYIDDVYHSTVVGAGLNLGDIERVEIKRGPQGTLEGNASIGGSIALYSKLPQGDDTGYVDATYGSFNKVQLDAAFDTTLVSDLFMRVSGSFDRQDGYVDVLDFTCMMNRLGTPELAGTLPQSSPGSEQRGCKVDEQGGTNHSSIKAMLRYRPEGPFEANFQIAYAENDDQTTPELLIRPTNPYPNPNALVRVYNDQMEKMFNIRYDERFLPPPGNRYASYSSFCRPNFNGDVVQQPPFQPVPNGFCYPNKSGMEAFNTSLRLDYDLNDKLHLKTIFAHRDYTGKVFQNGDESPLGYVLTYIEQPVQQQTAEVRLNGLSFNDRLSWVTGAFYLTFHAENNGSIGFVANNFTQTDTAYKHSASAFFHGDFKITDHWSVSGGARYSDNRLQYRFVHPGLLIIDEPFNVSETRVDWLASTSYQFTDDTMAYLTVATGSRPPGITTIVNTAEQLSPIPAEELTSYEIGVKSEWFDRRVRLNVGVFHSDYSKRLITQVGVECFGQPGTPTWFPRQSDCAAFPDQSSVPWFITSARPAKVQGAELELTARPVNNLLLNYSAGYNNFKSGVKTPGQPGYIAPGNLQQPRWNMAGGIQYGFALPAGTLTPRVDWSFQTDQTFNPSPSIPLDPTYVVPKYSIFNAQATCTPNDSKWMFVASVTNLTDKFYYYQLFNGAAINVSSNVAPPREYFFKVRRDF